MVFYPPSLHYALIFLVFPFLLKSDLHRSHVFGYHFHLISPSSDPLSAGVGRFRLTLPRTLLKPAHDTRETHTCGDDVLIPNAVSLITILYSELPYCQAITATTPSLHVQLDRLSLTLEFVQVFSGHLSIAQAEDTAIWSKRYQIIDIRDIPTTELQ